MPSYASQVFRDFCVAMLNGPDIERRQSHFVDQGLGQTVNAEVDGFQVVTASVASFYSDVFAFLGGVVRKLLLVRLGTIRA